MAVCDARTRGAPPSKVRNDTPISLALPPRWKVGRKLDMPDARLTATPAAVDACVKPTGVIVDLQEQPLRLIDRRSVVSPGGTTRPQHPEVGLEWGGVRWSGGRHDEEEAHLALPMLERLPLPKKETSSPGRALVSVSAFP
jgi:hypothetical protein